MTRSIGAAMYSSLHFLRYGVIAPTLLALVSVAISSVFTYIYMKFIDNSMIQQILDKQREAMEERGMDDAQIDQAMTMTEKFMTPEIMLGTGLFFGVVIIVIVALLISLVTQKKNPEEVI